MEGNKRAKRVIETLIESHLNFDLIIFTSTMFFKDDNSDNTSFMITTNSRIEMCREQEMLWTSLDQSTPTITIPYLDEALAWLSQDRNNEIACRKLNDSTMADQALPQEAKKASRLQVVITGSLKLCGSALTIIQPNACFSKNQSCEKIVSEYESLFSKHNACSM